MAGSILTSDDLAPVGRRRSDALDDLPVRVTFTVLERLSASPTAVLAVALVLMLLAGIADWLTGPDLAFSAFYLLPVAAVAWTSSGIRALLVAGAAAGTWLIADLAAGVEYSNAFVPAWNVMVRLAVFALVAHLFAQLRRALHHERQLARVDHLTGVSNSRWFAEQGRAALARRSSQCLTLLFLDIDDFKVINDQAGHSGGDEVLRHVGQALRASVRDGDLVGRMGGDELAVLLELSDDGRSRVAVQAIVDRMRAALACVDPPVGFSGGAVTFAEPPATLDEALAAADALMYEVKRSGKGGLAHRVVRAQVPGTIDLR